MSASYTKNKQTPHPNNPQAWPPHSAAPPPVNRPTPTQIQTARRGSRGFTLTETLVSAAAGAILVTGGAIALRTIS